MASIEFKDSEGTHWRVWSTVPISGAVINPGFDRGWLTFESEHGTLKRLAPIPSGWESAPANRLTLYCKTASEVPRHTGPFRRPERPDAEAGEPTDRR